MNNKTFSSKLSGTAVRSGFAALALGAGLMLSTNASAQNVSLNIGGMIAPGVYGSVTVGEPVQVHQRHQRYYAPPVVYPAPPVHYQPPQVVYQQPPVYYQQPPVYYQQPQVIVRPPVMVSPRYYGYRDGYRDGHRGHGYGHRGHHHRGHY